jgi:hypothetical protein
VTEAADARVPPARRSARTASTACRAAAGRSIAGRGGSAIRPRARLTEVTAITGTAQAVSAAARRPRLGSCRAANQTQNAASAIESAYAPNAVTWSRRRASHPSARSVAMAAAPSIRPPPNAGTLARVKVSRLAQPSVRRWPSRPRWVIDRAQLVATQARPSRRAATRYSTCKAVTSAAAHGRATAADHDDLAACPTKRPHAAGRQPPARNSASNASVLARLSSSRAKERPPFHL